jgi:hypothetical protein
LLFLTNLFCSLGEVGQERLRRNGATHPPQVDPQFPNASGAYRARFSVRRGVPGLHAWCPGGVCVWFEALRYSSERRVGFVLSREALFHVPLHCPAAIGGFLARLCPLRPRPRRWRRSPARLLKPWRKESYEVEDLANSATHQKKQGSEGRPRLVPEHCPKPPLPAREILGGRDARQGE